jgi:hypothetical protein
MAKDEASATADRLILYEAVIFKLNNNHMQGKNEF